MAVSYGAKGYGAGVQCLGVWQVVPRAALARVTRFAGQLSLKPSKWPKSEGFGESGEPIRRAAVGRAG
jgi:hypothetical protein